MKRGELSRDEFEKVIVTSIILLIVLFKFKEKVLFCELIKNLSSLLVLHKLHLPLGLSIILYLSL